MKSIRERLGSVISSSRLTWEKDGQEANIDQLVASAWTGDYLGRILARFKYGGDSSTTTYRTCLWKLVERSTPRRATFGMAKPTADLIGMCGVALAEWSSDTCPACQGRAFVTSPRPGPCPSCKGIGRVEWTEEARRAACVDLEAAYDRFTYQHVICKLQEADQRYHNQARKGINHGT